MIENFDPYPKKEWQMVLDRVAKLRGWNFENNCISIVFPNNLTHGFDCTGGRRGVYINPVNAGVVRGRAKCITPVPHRRFSTCEIDESTCLDCKYDHMGCPLKQKFFPDN